MSAIFSVLYLQSLKEFGFPVERKVMESVLVSVEDVLEEKVSTGTC